MPFNDQTTITGGYNQAILDWYLGDDRVFSGNVSSLILPDITVAAAFFTLKQNPNDIDANAILQKKITPAGGNPSGIITSATALLFHVFSGDYQALVAVGPVYSWDFRVITGANSTITLATGTVAFQQNTTRSDAAGTPAALPNFGQPRFRGFIASNPQFLQPIGLFNVGDVYYNSVPVVGQPVGWICTQAGVNGSWFSLGPVGLTGSFLQGPQGPPGPPGLNSFIPQTNWSWAPSIPNTPGKFGDICWNIAPTSGSGNSSNVGWIYTIDKGWKEFGPIGN